MRASCRASVPHGTAYQILQLRCYHTVLCLDPNCDIVVGLDSWMLQDEFMMKVNTFGVFLIISFYTLNHGAT